MKYIFSVLFFSFLVSADKSESYKIEGMHCGYGCVNKVKSLVNSLEGVKLCDVSYENSSMEIQYDDTKVNSEMILKLLSDNTTYKTALVVKEKEKKSFWSKFKGIFKS